MNELKESMNLQLAESDKDTLRPDELIAIAKSISQMIYDELQRSEDRTVSTRTITCHKSADRELQ